MSSGQRYSKTKLNLEGDYQALVRLCQIVLVVVRQGGWTALTLAKAAQGRVGERL
jgi:hypothetical protein